MYLSYYKLNKKPFQISTDPNFLWLGEKHKEALSILKYGIWDNMGFLLLTGDVGTGKTTLINAFVRSLGNEVIVARVSDPGLTKLGFIKFIAEMFRMETDFETKSEFLIRFTRFLERAHTDNKKVLLIIDEAQQLTEETLEEIRLLSNIERPDKKLLNIILVGQNEFNETLAKYKNRALRQRLTINYTLYPFEPEETKACIEFRLAVAGSKKEIFTPEAIAAIHTISGGFPRVINIICDHVLLLGCLEEQETISEELVRKCSKELYLAHLPHSHQNEDFFASTEYWLEDSEIPPLTSEAIQRASQPLPDLTVEPEKEPKRKSRRYRAIVPLLIAALLLSGFYVVKYGKIESISQFIASRFTETIASTLEKERTVAVSAQKDKENGKQEPSKVTSDSEITISKPVLIVETQQELTKKQAEPIQVTDRMGQKIQPGTNETTFYQPLETKTNPELIEKAKTQTDTQSGITSNQKIKLPGNQDKEQPEVIEQQSPTIPALEPPQTDNRVSLEPVTKSNTAPGEAENTEFVEVQQPQPLVTKITALAENEIINGLESLPQPATGSTTEEIEPPSSAREKITEPEKPAPPTATAEPDAKNDPGAVIDWLLKSRQKP